MAGGLLLIGERDTGKRVKGKRCTKKAFQVVLVGKNLPPHAGDVRDTGSVPGLGRSPGGGHSNPLQ